MVTVYGGILTENRVRKGMLEPANIRSERVSDAVPRIAELSPYIAEFHRGHVILGMKPVRNVTNQAKHIVTIAFIKRLFRSSPLTLAKYRKSSLLRMVQGRQFVPR